MIFTRLVFIPAKTVSTVKFITSTSSAVRISSSYKKCALEAYLVDTTSLSTSSPSSVSDNHASSPSTSISIAVMPHPFGSDRDSPTLKRWSSSSSSSTSFSLMIHLDELFSDTMYLFPPQEVYKSPESLSNH